MQVICCDPSDDMFFVGVSFAEFDQLKEKYKFKNGTLNYEHDREHVERHSKEIGENSYSEMIKKAYGISHMPDLCFAAKRNLSELVIHLHHYPFHQLWNGYSPWRKIDLKEIASLEELQNLNMIYKGKGYGKNS